MPEDLDAKVLKWLRTQGYPFELEVAQLFRRHKWEVDHARAYTDLKTKGIRQIDVTASLHRSIQPDLAGATFTLVVECKKSAKPWVIFSAPRNPDYPSFAVESAADRLSRELIWRLIQDFDGRSILLAPAGMLGHGAVRAEFTTSNTDDSYKPHVALQEALSAARALGDANRLMLERERRGFEDEMLFPRPWTLSFRWWSSTQCYLRSSLPTTAPKTCRVSSLPKSSFPAPQTKAQQCL